MIVLFRSLILMLIVAAPLSAAPKKFFVFLGPAYNVGLFSHFTTVIGYLDQVEKNTYEGLYVNFLNTGLYYQKQFSLNWWEYYFEPINVGNTSCPNRKNLGANKNRQMSYDVIINMPRERASELVSRYIQVKPAVLDEVNAFVDNEYQDHFIIGVHYRGTDKITSKEAKFVSYDEIANAVTRQINNRNLNHYKIFVATDVNAFLVYMQKQFPNKIIYQNAVRSTSNFSIHNKTHKPYQIGKEAVIDCLLLSRADYLIRTSSNLSQCATFF